MFLYVIIIDTVIEQDRWWQHSVALAPVCRVLLSLLHRYCHVQCEIGRSSFGSSRRQSCRKQRMGRGGESHKKKIDLQTGNR